MESERPFKSNPPQTSDILPRPRLWELLSQAPTPVIWLTAPAGSGKSSLVADWLSGEVSSNKYAWLTLDKTDRDPVAFCYQLRRAIVTATRSRETDPGKKVPAGLPRHFPPESGQTPAQFVEQLVESLLTDGGDWTLVLDDFHALDHKSPVPEILTDIMSRSPEGIRFIITSRQPPRGPCRLLKARGRLTLVRDHQLAFSEEEVARFLKARKKGAGVPGLAGEVHSWSRGWVTGVILLVAAGTTGREFSKERKLNPEFQADMDAFFETEMEGLFTAGQWETLSGLAWLPFFTTELAAGLFPAGASEPLIHTLIEGNLFLEADGSGNACYRFHPLWRDFLRRRGERTLAPEEITRVHRQGAGFLEKMGHPAGALELLEPVGDQAANQRLILQLAPDWIRTGRHHQLAEVIARLPEKIRQGNPALLYWQGRAHQPQDFPASLEIFRQCLEAAQAREDWHYQLSAWREIVLGTIFARYNLGDLRYWLDWLEERRADFATRIDAGLWARLTATVLGAAAHLQFYQLDQDYWRGQAETLLQRAKNPTDLFLLATGMFSYFTMRSHFDQSKLAAETILERVDPESLAPVYHGVWYNIISWYHYTITGDIQEAYAAALEGHRRMEKLSSGLMKTDVLNSAIRAALHLPDGEKLAAPLLERAGELRDSSGDFGRFVYYQTRLHQLLLARENGRLVSHPEIHSYLAAALDMIPPEDIVLRLQILYLRACFLKSRGECEQAKGTLEEMGAGTDRLPGENTRYIYFLAAAYFAWRDRDKSAFEAHFRALAKTLKKTRVFCLLHYLPPFVLPVLFLGRELKMEVEVCDRALELIPGDIRDRWAQLLEKDLERDPAWSTGPTGDWIRRFETSRDECLVRLHHLLAGEEIFRDPNLSQIAVAQKLGVSRQYLSARLNRELGVTFYRLVHHFRIRAAREVLEKDPGKKILEVAYDSGFNNKGTFNKIFRQFTGMAPSEYRKAGPGGPAHKSVVISKSG